MRGNKRATSRGVKITQTLKSSFGRQVDRWYTFFFPAVSLPRLTAFFKIKDWQIIGWIAIAVGWIALGRILLVFLGFSS